jgi:hypothetical protein
MGKAALTRAPSSLLGLLSGAALATLAGAAWAAPEPSPAAAKAALPTEKDADTERRLRELEASNARLREEVDRLRDEHTSLDERLQGLLPLSGRVSGYLDFGFFYVQGDGTGIRNDFEHKNFPEYAGTLDTWVFMGDPLSTAINARGEPASTGASRAVTFDAIRNSGKASFIINALNLALFASLGESLTLNGSVDFVPRGRDVSDAGGLFLGDFLDVKLAYVEYLVPVTRFKLSLYAGKFDSVLGYEYRAQDAPDRLGVTPSLLCRYTCGRPLGLKARGQLWDDTLTLNVAVTNGSNTTENFPFSSEIDQNNFKTISARVSSRAPLGAGLEAGVSGSFGAQDLQARDNVYHWHYGVDLHLDWHDVELTAEFMQGQALGFTAPGELACETTQCLRYKGAYGQVGYRLFNWLTPYARVDWRDALHRHGASFVYISELLRATFGLHFEIGTSVIAKAEYTLNRELGRTPPFPNDIFTSSLVVKY